MSLRWMIGAAAAGDDFEYNFGETRSLRHTALNVRFPQHQTFAAIAHMGRF